MNLDQTIEIQAAEPLTLDLNGKNLYYTREGDDTISQMIFSLKSDMAIDGQGLVQSAGGCSYVIWLDGGTITKEALFYR